MKWCALAVILAAGCPACAQDTDAEPVDAVEQYLADLGLDELRAQFLEGRLDTLGGSERIAIARRLADLYARMLREAADDAARSRLEERASALLKAIPQVESDELELSLARANFERAESILERWRVRAVEEEQARGAIASMAELADTFDRLGRQSHDRVQRLESREERAADQDLPMIEERINEALERRSTSFYLAGWAHRYGAEFSGSREAAYNARVSYGWLLNARTGREPELDRVPEGNAQLPHIALSMLSVSYTYAFQNNASEASAWYRRVETAEDAPPSVVEQLPTRRLIALCALEDWRAARTLLDGMPPDDGRLVLMARLAAVLASEELAEDPDDGRARALRDAGFAQLVARGELAQAVEVAEAFGVDSVPPTGFVGSLVRGVMAYQDARAAHQQHAASTNTDANAPTRSDDLRARYADAGDQLLEALNAPDAPQSPAAQGGAGFVLGMARYYEGRFAAAAELFQAAADDGAGTPAEADALWMAVLAHDAAGTGEGGARDALVDRFLERFPDHPRASRLTMRRALEREDDPERSLELLLAITPGDPSYESARRQAARLAYRQAAEAPAPVRSARARRFLDIAEPLLAKDRRLASEDPAAAERAATTARRILGVALRLDTPDVSRARRAFDALDSMAQRGLITTDGFAGELLFRRAEFLLAVDDVEGAEAALEELQGVDPDLAAQGDRLIWRDAVSAWRRLREPSASDQRSSDLREGAARRVVRVGGRLIDEMGGADALSDAANASVYRAAAQAGADLWRWSKDEAARADAQGWFRALIDAGYESIAALEGFVEMARAGGAFVEALEAQRRLVSGLESGTRAWFEARTTQLEILADVNVSRARDALRQHIALYPELGPEPWRSRLRTLAERVNVPIGGER